MTSKAIMATVLLLLGGGGAQAQLAITDKAIIRKTGRLLLDIHYPVTGMASVDWLLDRRSMAHMDREDMESATPEEPYSVSVSYKVRRNDAQMLSVQISSYVYTGGAHGMPDMQSHNFLMPEGREIGLSDLVEDKRGLERVRDLVVDDLNRQMPNLPKPVHLEAREDWLRNFVWKPDELEVTFTPYEVAAYAQGTLVVHIPMARLKDVIRPDPRKPAASFDCGKAASRIEKAICTDAELARLDRKVEQKFAYARDSVSVPEAKPNEMPSQMRDREVALGHRNKAIAWQRAWLARRDHDCVSGSVACLKASYQVHLRDNTL